jgi:hypothetical protein
LHDFQRVNRENAFGGGFDFHRATVARELQRVADARAVDGEIENGPPLRKVRPARTALSQLS